MTVEDLEALPDGAIVTAGGNMYQKHSGRFKAWFCVDGHTPERMVDPDIVRQPVEVVS